MPLVRTVPHTWQFHPPPYGPLRPVVGATPVRVLQTGELATNVFSDQPLLDSYHRMRPEARLGLAAAGLGAWPILVAKGVAIAISAVRNLKARSGARRIMATEVVNWIEPSLQGNLDQYLAGPRTVSAQLMHLEQFDLGWAFVLGEEGCGTGNLGQAGRRCISDRQRNGQFDWFARYRDPIQDDPKVGAAQELTAGASDFLASLFGGAPSVTGPAARPGVASYAPLLIGVALIGVALVAVKK